MRAKSPAHLLPITVILILVLMVRQAASQDRRLELASPQPNPGQYYALVIGNNAYQSIARLETAESDATVIGAILRERYGFQTNLLLNATRQQIVSALNAYRRELDSESNLLIYYAGHGVFDREVGRAYWLPVDASQHDNSNWISADDITSNIKGIPAKHVIIVSDSCYSGALKRGIGAVVSEPASRERYLQKMMDGKSRTLMASGGNEPVADGMGKGNHSVFASALMRGLTQMEKERFTAAELYREFVEESVAGSVNQTPEYNPLLNSGHESGDFVFVRIGMGQKTVTATPGAKRSTPPIDPAVPTQDCKSQPAEQYKIGMKLVDKREWAKAEAVLLCVVESNPKDVLALYNLGVTQLNQKSKWTEAEDSFQRAIDNGYRKSTAYYNLGAAQLNLRKFEKAESNFGKYIELECKGASAGEEKCVKAYYNLGVALRGQGKETEAEDAFRRAGRPKQ